MPITIAKSLNFWNEMCEVRIATRMFLFTKIIAVQLFHKMYDLFCFKS